MKNKVLGAVCEACNNAGYLEVKQYGKEGVRRGHNAIERCDNCQVFESDEQAQIAFKNR